MQKEATPRPAAHGRRFIAFLTVFTFTVQLILPPAVLAQGIPQTLLNLPVPGTMLGLSAPYTPALMTGITIHPENPLQFDFLVDTGDDHLAGDALQNESKKLINYFMASLTVPENEMWVNLSPHEKNRIVADGLSKTEMGRDMLAQDYLLKQLAASLLYPEGKTGAEFWKRVRAKAQEKFGAADIPTDLFNKVWIVPEEASVYVHGNNVFVTESRLKVMLEQDYVASSNAAHPGGVNTPGVGLSAESAQLIREVILPEIEKEINEGKNFANLRQIYHSMILATWYKGKLRSSILGQAYLDKNKTGGIELEDKDVKEKIYNQYLEALKKGVYNYIKEDYDPVAEETIPRKYFSGGLRGVTRVAERNRPSVAWMAKQSRRDFAMVAVNADVMGANLKIPDRAMLSTGNFMKAVDLLKDFLARDKSSDFYQELSEYGPVDAVISFLNLSDEMANVVEAIIGPRFIIAYGQLSAHGREFTLEQLFEQAQRLVLDNLTTLTSENWQKSQLVILFALVPYVHPGPLHPNDMGNSKIENFDIGGHKITGLAETHWDPHAVKLLREVLQADKNFIPSQGKDWVFALESSEELLSAGQFLGNSNQLALKIADVFDIPVIYPVLNRSNDLVVREALERVSARYQGITLEDIAGFLADSLAEQVFDRDLTKAADVMARGWGSLMTAGDIILAGERWRASSEEGSDAKARAIDSVLHEVESEWTARKLQNELKQHPDRKKVLFLAGYHHVDALKVYFQGEEFSIKGDDLRNLQSWLANLDNKYFLREEAQGVHSPVDDDVRKMEFKLSRSPGYPALPSQARIEDWRMLISLEQLFRLLENIEATYWYMNFELISMFVGARGTLKYPQLFDKARVRRIASRNFNKENLMIASWLFSLQEKLGLIASNTSHLPEGSFEVFSNGNLGWEKGKGDKNDSLPDKIEFVRLFGADKKSRSKAGLFSVRTEGNGAPERLRGLTPDEVVNFTRLLTRELKVRKHLRQESNTQEITIFHEALTDFFIDLGQIYDVKIGNRRSDMAMMGEGEVTVATISDRTGKWTHEELKLYFKLLNDPGWVAGHLGGHSPDVVLLKELVARRLIEHIIDESRGKKSNGKFFFRRLSNFGNPRYSFNVLHGWRVWNDGGTQSSGVNMSSVRVVFSAKEALKADPSESVLAELSEDGIHFEALGYKAVLDLDGNLTVEPLAGTTEPPVTLGSYFKDIFSIFGVDAVDITPGSQGKFTEMLKKLLEEQGITVTGAKGMDALGAEDVKTAGLAHDSKDLVIINGMVNSDSIEPALRILLNSGKLIITFAQSEASQEVSRAIEDAKKEIRRLSGIDRKFEYVLVGEDGEVKRPSDYPAAAGMPSLSERMLLVVKRIRADSYISAPDAAMMGSEIASIVDDLNALQGRTYLKGTEDKNVLASLEGQNHLSQLVKALEDLRSGPASGAESDQQFVDLFGRVIDAYFELMEFVLQKLVRESDSESAEAYSRFLSDIRDINFPWFSKFIFDHTNGLIKDKEKASLVYLHLTQWALKVLRTIYKDVIPTVNRLFPPGDITAVSSIENAVEQFLPEIGIMVNEDFIDRRIAGIEDLKNGGSWNREEWGFTKYRLNRAMDDLRKDLGDFTGIEKANVLRTLLGADPEIFLQKIMPLALKSFEKALELRGNPDLPRQGGDRAMTASELSPEDVNSLLNAVKEEIVKNGLGAFTALRYLYQRDPRIPGDMRDDFFQRRRALAGVYVELNPGRNIPATELYTTLKRQIADFRLARDHSRLKFNDLQFALDRFYAYAERQGLLQGEGASELLAAVVTMKDQLEALRNDLLDNEQPIDWFDRAQEFDLSVSTGASLKALIEESETRAVNESQRRSATWGTSELAGLNSSDRQLLSAIKEKAAGPGQAIMIAKAAVLYGLKTGDLLIKDDQVVIVGESQSADFRIFFYVTFDPNDPEGLLLTRAYNAEPRDDGMRIHALGSADLSLHQFKHYRPLPDFYKKSGDRAMMREFIDPADLAVQEIHANADGRKLFVLGHSHFDPVTHSQFEEAMHRLVEAALISDFQEARSLLDQMIEIMNAHQDLLNDFRQELKDLRRAISSLKIKVIGLEEDFGEGPGITKQEFEMHQAVLRSLVKQIYPGDVKRLVDNLLLLHYGTERYLFFKESLGKQGILLVGVDSGEKIKQNEAGFNSTLQEFFAIFDYITQNGGNLESIHERLSFIHDEMGANSAIEPDEAKVAQWVGSIEDPELQRLVRQWIDSFAKTLRQTHARDPIIAENSLKVFEQHEGNVLIVIGAKHVSGIKKYFADLKSSDQAMTAEQATPGGIDFNAKNLNLKEQGSAVEIPFNFDSLEGLRPEQVNGILPVIINITPVPTIIPLLGLAADKEEQLSAL